MHQNGNPRRNSNKTNQESRDPEYEEKRARNLALRRLTVREYGSHELARYLDRKGILPDVIAKTIARLIEEKFLSDERYLKAMVQSLYQRGKGPLYIKAKLNQKGMSADVSLIRSLIAQLEGPTEVEQARTVIDRRYPGAQTDRAIAAKAISALMRRGFSYDVAREAVFGSRAEL